MASVATVLTRTFPGLFGWGGAISALSGVLGATALLLHPLSPGAMVTADTLAGAGYAESAVSRYEAIGEAGGAHALAALEKAGSLRAVVLHDDAGARADWMAALAHSAEPVELAELHLRVARSYAGSRRHAQAAESYRLAYRLDATQLDALNQAARQSELAGDLTRARKLWDQLARRSETHAARARVEIGRTWLARGDAERGLAAFEAAARVATTEDDAALARLGSATCLERLGNLDEALAEIDQAELPESVRRTRQQGIEARQNLLYSDL